MKKQVNLKLCMPNGFCAGVERAIEIVVLALKKYSAPVYVRHEIVHNRYVVQALANKGAIFIEDLSEIPLDKRDSPVIFSAHGVAKDVHLDAMAKNLFYLDATCPLVSKVHKQAIKHQKMGRHILLIGHAGHPEVIGTMGQVDKHSISLIENVVDANNFIAKDPTKLGYVTQTTLSVEDTSEIIAILKQRYPLLAEPAAQSICYATTNRQHAVKVASPDCDYFIIIGSPNSSNSKRLVEVAANFGAKRQQLVQSAADIDWDYIDTIDKVAISAGASAPQILLNDIIASFEQKYDVNLELVETVIEDQKFLPSRELRDTILTEEDMEFINGSNSVKWK